jgi:2-phospho-L-lactate guanylyltransferase
LAAIVPVKSFTAAKSRLGGLLSAEERRQVACHLLERTLAVLRDARVVDTTVVTADVHVQIAARALGAKTMADTGVGHGAAIHAALGQIPDQPTLVLMCDLPRLSSSDIESIAIALCDAEVVLAPDLHEAGTNALALRRPRAMSTHFGATDSFHRHRAAASAAGLRSAVLRRPGLAFDLDGPDDWLRLLEVGGRISGG